MSRDRRVLADERDRFQAAMHQMRDAFAEVLQHHPERHHRAGHARLDELNGQFFDGYAEANRIFGTVLLIRDVTGT